MENPYHHRSAYQFFHWTIFFSLGDISCLGDILHKAPSHLTGPLLIQSGLFDLQACCTAISLKLSFRSILGILFPSRYWMSCFRNPYLTISLGLSFDGMNFLMVYKEECMEELFVS